ncbi:MAG TPA: nucleotidyltransferase family protein [Parvularculaceae bacterium]|nr:nucleotidyltransferase family protein [Parvularculaceae bacterium]
MTLNSSGHATHEALILAGRRRGEIDPLAAIENTSHKAILTAGGETLIHRVLIALRASGRISTVKIAAPEDIRSKITEALADIDGWTFSDALESPAATALAEIETIGSGRGFVLTTCDHALLSASMIREFLDAAENSDAAAGCVEKRRYQARFPGSRRTFIRLRDFEFSGANLFWFAGKRASGLASFWRRLESKRKNPAAMAKEIGLFTALSYATGFMTKRGLEKTITNKTGVSVKLTPLSNAEAAIDVDKPEDLALVRKILESRRPESENRQP